MIKVSTRGDICNECPYFSAEEIKRPIYENNECIGCNTQIICRHRDFCRKLEDYLKKQIKKAL